MLNTDVELLQFPYSTYNEKARWALDYKRVPHRRQQLLPGPHAVVIMRLTGQTQVPVVRFGAEVVHGSARVIEELERRVPEPALYPADPALRKRALELEAWLDRDVGPQVRCALFSIMLDEPEYVCRMFSSDRNAPTRAIYRAMFPVTRGIMKKGMGITSAAAIERAFAATQEALEFVAKEADGNGCLVGGAFTVADLAAAALLAPTAMPAGSPMALPEPRPARISAWLERWSPHPGVAWIVNQYRSNRPPSAEESGASGAARRAA